MTEIISIGTAVPAHRHAQSDIRQFMERVFALDPAERRKLRFLYQQSAIDYRYSVIPDYSLPPSEWSFYPDGESLEPVPTIEKRMEWYNRYAVELSAAAIADCFNGIAGNAADCTHLITVSCTGMSAPGLDLALVEKLALPLSISRSSINFMGCYAALHAMRQADAICRSEPEARVLIVCTELCTLHFQKEPSPDNIAASLLFGDGAAAVLLQSGVGKNPGISGFHSEIMPAGKNDMSWNLSSTGFLMRLSGYVPDLIQADFKPMILRALAKFSKPQAKIGGWCIHPGGKRILEAVVKSLSLPGNAMEAAYEVLKEYGNMSSPTVLFVLKRMLEKGNRGNIIVAAFGPGISMETCLLEARLP